jgi:hypothetical protein
MACKNKTESFPAKKYAELKEKKAVGKRWSNSSKITVGEEKFDSKFEADRDKTLKLKVLAKQILDYKTQVPYKLIVNGYEVGTYKIDFEVHNLDGTIELEETKGHATDVWKLRWKILCAMLANDPKYKLTLIKQRNNWTMREIKKVK